MPGVASGTAGVVGATDSSTNMPELTSAAEAAGILIHTHGHGTNCDDSACPDRGD